MMKRSTLKYATQLRRKSGFLNAQAKDALSGLHDTLAMTRLRIERSLKSIERSNLLIGDLAQFLRPHREMLD
jgi:hypothetical protein